MKCPYCKAIINDNSIVCPYCDQRLKRSFTKSDPLNVREVTGEMPSFYAKAFPLYAIFIAFLFPPLGLALSINATIGSKREIGHASGLAIFGIVLSSILMIGYMVLIIFIVLISAGVFE